MIPTKEEWHRALADRHGEAFQKGQTPPIANAGSGVFRFYISIRLAKVVLGKLYD